jgi:uncharacterized RDD family membrane protein YckC
MFLSYKPSYVTIEGHTYQLASFNRRLFASTIDIILCALILIPLTNLIYWIFGISTKIQQFNEQMIVGKYASFNDVVNELMVLNLVIPYIINQVISLCVLGTIIVLFWYKKGASIGKMITKCKIIDAKLGCNITLKQAIIRFLSYILSSLILMIGFLMVNFSKNKQGLHDKLAGTLVILREQNNLLDQNNA